MLQDSNTPLEFLFFFILFFFHIKSELGFSSLNAYFYSKWVIHMLNIFFFFKKIILNISMLFKTEEKKLKILIFYLPQLNKMGLLFTLKAASSQTYKGKKILFLLQALRVIVVCSRSKTYGVFFSTKKCALYFKKWNFFVCFWKMLRPLKG